MLTRTKKAFTLLELIVVLLVLGILAAIAVPTFNTVKRNSAVQTAEASAEGVARNADSIAASSGDNGAVAQGDLDTAISESESFTHTAGDLTATKTVGGYTVTCTWVLGDADSATTASCEINS
jgi:prepilin-type N-terminal cleavage/methylation domain-containing protein